MKTKKMKILLLAITCTGMRENYEELGVCYIASFLREKEYEVKLIGCREQKVDYEEIKEFDPDVVGFTVYEISKPSVCRVCEKVKEMLPKSVIFVGGTYPTYAYQEILNECPAISYAIRGEGEITTWELMKAIETESNDLSSIDGLSYRLKGKVVSNPNRELIKNIDELPWPARDLLVYHGAQAAMISTSRGCIANCSFCSNQLFWSRWRGRSAKSIVDEIEYVQKNYGIHIFNFTDASFEDPDKELTRLKEIANELIKRKLNIFYIADFRAEFQRKADDSIMELLVDSGLCGACIGIEAGNEADLRVYNKIARLEDNIKIVNLFRKHDINILPGFINFNPYTTFESLRENMKFLKEYEFAASLEVIVNRYRMYRGASLYQRMKEDGLLVETEEFDETAYNFQDSRIQVLADYVYDYITDVNRDPVHNFEVITNFVEFFYTFINHLQRLFSDVEILQQIFSDFRDDFRKIKLEINQNVFDWMIHVMDLAEDSWDVKKADEITQQYVGRAYVKEKVQGFHQLFHSVYIKLLRIDSRYGDEFLKIVDVWK